MLVFMFIFVSDLMHARNGTMGKDSNSILVHGCSCLLAGKKEADLIIADPYYDLNFFLI